MERLVPKTLSDRCCAVTLKRLRDKPLHLCPLRANLDHRDPARRAVEQADALVAEVIKQLANSFAEARSSLEGQWGRGDKVSTEDLRVTLQRYRAFFDRLLNI